MKFFFMLLFGLSSLSAATFHAIIVVDTKDPLQKKMFQNDCHDVELQVKEIAKICNLKLKKSVLQGKSVKVKKLFSAIEKLKVSNEDSLFFYFSGHGFRTEEKDIEGNPWPNLYFSQEKTGIDFLKVSQKLEEKHPKALFVIADVCNNSIAGAFAPLVARGIQEKILLNEKAHFLFSDFSGVVRATASVPGTFAWAKLEGGIFTRAFFFSLDQELKAQSTPTWEGVFEMVKFLLCGPVVFQEPYYEIEYK